MGLALYSPLPAHILAITLILTGLIGTFLQVIGRRRRNRLLLAAPIGNMASTIALTSRSGFGELLLPYDDELTLEKKLGGLRFQLDKRTGAIIAEEIGTEKRGSDDDATSSLLLSGRRTLPSSTQPTSSSDLTYPTATENGHRGPRV